MKPVQRGFLLACLGLYAMQTLVCLLMLATIAAHALSAWWLPVPLLAGGISLLAAWRVLRLLRGRL